MGGELRDKVASGVAWSLGEKLGTILLQMVVSIVVARLLMPDDVGLMALMTFFSSLALVVVDSGFSQMLIRKGDPAQGDYKSVFLFNVVVSWIVYGVLVAVFPAVAAFLRAADSGAYRAGALSSGAGQCAGYDPEYDLHAAVPLRAAVEDHFRRVACERCAGRDDGAGRMRRVEPGRAASLVDRGAGGAAVVFQRLAAAPHAAGFDAPAA